MSKRINGAAYREAMEKAEQDPGSARFWVGVDVGMRSSALCVIDAQGSVIHQAGMKSSPVEIGRYLRKNFQSHVTLIGMEAGSVSMHLAKGLRRQGFEVVVLDTMQVHRVLQVKRNKTDVNDARGIAEITRSGRDYLSEVFVKSALAYEIRAQLTLRHRLVRQRLANQAPSTGSGQG